MKTGTIICNTYEDVENAISKIRRPGKEFVFRGLPDDSYSLQTRIEDKLKDRIKANDCVKKMIESFKNLIDQGGLTSEIYKDNFPFKTMNYKNDWYLICQAQHLGIPTMLMDWSLDWKKALFFSVFDLTNESKSGLLWCFDISSFTYNDDQLDSKSIYSTNPFDYKGQPRIINPSFELGVKGGLATKRMDYQCGRFFISSLDDSCEPMENQACFKDRLTKIVITHKCKAEIIKKYYTPQEVPFILSGLQGVYSENGKCFKKFDHNFFYGSITEPLDNIVKQVRKIADSI